MYEINFWSILVASIVAFVIGAIWYSPLLFGKEWMALNNMSEKDVATAKNVGMVKFYVIQFIMTLITFIVMGFAISILDANGQDGAMIGLLSWIGFTLPIGISALLWEKKPFKLTAINTVNILLTYVIGGALIGAWQ